MRSKLTCNQTLKSDSSSTEWVGLQTQYNWLNGEGSQVSSQETYHTFKYNAHNYATHM